MNTWTDILLVVAIVIGVISAASLPVVSVNAISSEALRLHEVRGDAPPWLLMDDDVTRRRAAAWNEISWAAKRQPARGATSMSALSSSASVSPTAGMTAFEAAATRVGGVVEALPTVLLDPAPAAPVAH
jgi:hypothetical protein